VIKLNNVTNVGLSPANFLDWISVHGTPKTHSCTPKAFMDPRFKKPALDAQLKKLNCRTTTSCSSWAATEYWYSVHLKLKAQITWVSNISSILQ